MHIRRHNSVLGDTILPLIEFIYHSMGYVFERDVLLDQEVSRSISHPPIEHLPAPRFNPAPGGRAEGPLRRDLRLDDPSASGGENALWRVLSGHGRM